MSVADRDVGIKLVLRVGGVGSSAVGGGIPGERGGIETTDGLRCSTISKDVSVGVKTMFARLGEPFTGESDLGTLSAVGGAFLEPFKLESRGRLDESGIIGASVNGLAAEYLFVEEFGTLKLGVPGEKFRVGLAGPP